MFTQRMTVKALLFSLIIGSSNLAWAAKTDVTLDLISTLKGNPSFEKVQWIIMHNKKNYKVINGHSTSLQLPPGQYQIYLNHKNNRRSIGLYNLKASEHEKVQVPLDQAI